MTADSYLKLGLLVLCLLKAGRVDLKVLSGNQLSHCRLWVSFALSLPTKQWSAVILMSEKLGLQNF